MRRILALVAGATFFLGGPSAALAAWLVTGSDGSGSSKALLMPAGPTPTAAPAGSSVTVQWPASTLSTGTPVAGYVVKAYNAGSGVSRAIGAGCTGVVSAVTCTETAPDGSWRYSVTPAQGPWRGAEGTRSIAVTVDTTAPVVTLTAPANSSSTTNPKPTFAGAAGTAAGDSTTVTVTVYNGTGTGGTVAATLSTTRSGAAWSVAPSTNLATGTYTARAAQSDAAGNTGTSATSTFTVVGAPATPSVPDLAAASDSGSLATDNVTNVNTPTFTGTADPASTVTILGDGTPVGTAFATSTGTYSVTTSQLANGTHAITATTTSTGLTSSPSGSVSVTIDTVGPTIAFTFPSNGSTVTASNWNAGCATSTTGDVCGTAADSRSGVASVATQIEKSGAACQLASQPGKFTKPCPNFLAATGSPASWSQLMDNVVGSYTLTAKATDVAGNVTTLVETFTIA